MATNTEIASTIVNQLGGMGRLNMMTGAYNFGALPNGVTFRIKNQRANVIKITLTSMDLYNLEVGRLRGGKYTIVTENLGLYNDMLKPAIEKATGMYLSLQDGGTLVSERRFTDYDFDKLMESGLFRAHRSVVLLNIYPTNGSKLVGKFNSEKEYLYISGKKDLSNPLVEWLSENSYVTSDEYRSLADGGGVGGTFDSSSTGEVLGGTYGSSESGEMIGGTMASSMYKNGGGVGEDFSVWKLSKSGVVKLKTGTMTALNRFLNKEKSLQNKGLASIFDGKSGVVTFPSNVTENEVIKYNNSMGNGSATSQEYAKGGGVGAIIEVVGKGDRGAFRKREYEGMTEKEVSDWWESRGYKPSKNKSESKLKPYTFYINKMANGGGIGGTSDSADMNAPMIGGTMSSSMFEGGSYDNKFENKLWNEIADGTPHSFKKGGKVEDCGCKEKYDEGGNAECGCWHYDIGGL